MKSRKATCSRKSISRPYEATLAQAKGQLARDEALLKGAQVDLARYQGLAAQNAVPRQTLDTQVALVAQDQGTVEADRAHGQIRRGEPAILPHPVAARRPRRTASGRPGQLRHARRRQRPRRDHADAADQRAVHGARRQSAGDFETASGRRRAARDRLRPQRRQQDRRRHAADLRQPDRSHHRNDQAAGAVSERNESALSKPVRQYPAAARHPQGRDDDADGGHPARRARHLRLSHQCRQHRVGPPGQARRHRWRPCRGPFRPRAGRSHRDRRRRQAARRRQDQRAGGSRRRQRRPHRAPRPPDSKSGGKKRRSEDGQKQ